ncbi:MAG: hypothetical protein J5733_06350 [Bacteroidaceae bacterium]|nr:hypothetical protein [Bacteroidaceae bacterium]
MESKAYSPCDYVNRARDNQPKPLTREYFETLLDDMNVKFLCDKVREHKPDAERYKTQLPAICWQSEFKGGLRTDRNAKPTGLFCLDVDIHHEKTFLDLCKQHKPEEAYRWAESEARRRADLWCSLAEKEDAEGVKNPADELSIVAVHVSPSGTGVHVVACCHFLCKDIAENQQRLARLLYTSYDEVCKDWARIFFVVPRSDWTYIDYKTLF